MARLTEPKRNDNGTAIAKKDLVIRGMPSEYCYSIVDKLADCEDLEYQGLLIKLPCKVGDTVWCTTKDFTSEKIPLRTFPCKVREITIKYGNFPALILKTNINEETYSIWWIAKAFSMDEIGKTIFLTEQDAEESLKENI